METNVVLTPTDRSPNNCEVRARLESICALFKAIEAGELLSALPECPLARENHRTATTLIAYAEAELYALCSEFGG